MSEKTKVRRVIRSGALTLKEGMTFDDIIDEAGPCLDEAHSWDICGEVLFEGDDGKMYAGTVEFAITEANPGYVRKVLAEDEDAEEDEEDEEDDA
jgi:hypothetical protein